MVTEEQILIGLAVLLGITAVVITILLIVNKKSEEEGVCCNEDGGSCPGYDKTKGKNGCSAPGCSWKKGQKTCPIAPAPVRAPLCLNNGLNCDGYDEAVSRGFPRSEETCKKWGCQWNPDPLCLDGSDNNSKCDNYYEAVSRGFPRGEATCTKWGCKWNIPPCNVAGGGGFCKSKINTQGKRNCVGGDLLCGVNLAAHAGKTDENTCDKIFNKYNQQMIECKPGYDAYVEEDTQGNCLFKCKKREGVCCDNGSGYPNCELDTSGSVVSKDECDNLQGKCQWLSGISTCPPPPVPVKNQGVCCGDGLCSQTTEQNSCNDPCKWYPDSTACPDSPIIYPCVGPDCPTRDYCTTIYTHKECRNAEDCRWDGEQCVALPCPTDGDCHSHDTQSSCQGAGCQWNTPPPPPPPACVDGPGMSSNNGCDIFNCSDATDESSCSEGGYDNDGNLCCEWK